MEETASINFVQLIIAGMFLAFLFTLAVILFIMIYQRKMITEKLKNKELKLSQERELLHNSFRIQEKERQNFAANLHDELGAQLSLTKMTVSSLEYTDQPKETVDNVIELLNDMADTIRRVSYNLLPPSLNKFGLNSVIKDFLDRLETGEVELVFEEMGSGDLADEIKLQLFRILQEALNNALKYSKATQIKITLVTSGDQAELKIEDNGIGFSTNEIKGLGILNMQRRSEMIHYSCQLESNQYGTTVYIVPDKCII
ncbi:MAG: ATP-binding protein [Flavobacteriales bacterium]|nr:ATP-binding protein [Flavobacteriales bacterium]